MVFNNKINVSGHFTIRVFKADGTIKETVEFDNLITNSGLNRMATGSIVVGCSIGSGTAIPTFADTNLSTFVAYTSTITNSTDLVQTSFAPFYGFSRRTFRFAVGALNGSFSEIGVGWASNQLFSRALIKDANGEPTRISVLSDEYLDVIYELRLYIQANDTVNIVNIRDKYPNVSLVTRPIYATAIGSNTNSSLVGWTPMDSANPLGGSCGSLRNSSAFYATTATTLFPKNSPSSSITKKSDTYTVTVQPYINNSFQRRVDVFYGLSSTTSTFQHFVIEIIMCGCYQFLFEQPIVKTNEETFTISFLTTWGRY